MKRYISLFIFTSIKRTIYSWFFLTNYNVFVTHFKIIFAINIKYIRKNSFEQIVSEVQSFLVFKLFIDITLCNFIQQFMEQKIKFYIKDYWNKVLYVQLRSWAGSNDGIGLGTKNQQRPYQVVRFQKLNVGLIIGFFNRIFIGPYTH